ncbi:MAG: IclR family transcriptional regulator, acetate operon repressor [Solirubrobacteraceae bacterium]|nr:IclR family transcriptional regulator, acetate operon repressor [Solirubrobacteraceae bacterium]
MLQVTWLLAARPEGVRADQVAEALGKSVSTAYNLLASLCDEGVAAHHAGGVYRLAPGFRDTVVTGSAREAELHDLSGLVADLLARTHKRSYLAVLRDGELQIVHERGLQGMPKLPGPQPRIADTAHALALGKVVLALGRPELVERYVRNPGLRRFTPDTITDPDALRTELETVRTRGVAVECEELYPDFCCIAAPVRDARGRVLAVLGISMTRRAFDDEQEALARVLVELSETAVRPRDMAPPAPSVPAPRGRFQPSAETQSVLDPAASTRLASPHGTTRAVSAACAHNPPSVSALARSERRHRP